MIFGGCFQPLYRSAFLHGTAPDLTLTIQLSNVTSAMEGAWQLLLGNSEGSGSVSLSISMAL